MLARPLTSDVTFTINYAWLGYACCCVASTITSCLSRQVDHYSGFVLLVHSLTMGCQDFTVD
jgi:hypothetical protein